MMMRSECHIFFYFLLFVPSFIWPPPSAVMTPSLVSLCAPCSAGERNKCFDKDKYGSSEYHNSCCYFPSPLVLTVHPETTAPEDDAGVVAVALCPNETLVTRVWGTITIIQVALYIPRSVINVQYNSFSPFRVLVQMHCPNGAVMPARSVNHSKISLPKYAAIKIPMW
jgi:hypothetical protein